MIFIINIKLRNTRKNPYIRLTVLAIEVPKLILEYPGNTTMSTQIHTLNTHRPAQAERTSSRALASLMLASGVAAFVVMADQMLEPWADEHHLAAWAALWAVAMASLLVLRGLTRALAGRTMRALDSWSARMAQRRADERLWHIAQSDARMMADLQSALNRDDSGDLNDLGDRRAAKGLHYI
jgi:hypothetical protein